MNKYKFILLSTLFLLVLCYVLFNTRFYLWFNIENIQGLVKSSGVWAPIVLWFIIYFAALFFVPITVFPLICGSLFGIGTGLFLLTTSTTLAAISAFFIGRYFDRFPFPFSFGKAKINRWILKTEELVHTRGFQAFFIIRNIPHPFILLSYVAGFVKTTKLRDFALATFVVLVIRGFAFVYMGDSILKGPKALILPVLLIAGITLLPSLIKRFFNKQP